MNKKAKVLLKQNNKAEKQLSKENIEVITDIVVYLRDCDITEYHQEEVRRDITNMLLEGEKRGESAQQVIGHDYKAFCDEIVEALPPISAREKLLSNVSGVIGCLWVLFLIYTVRSVVGAILQKQSPLYLPLTVGDIVSGMLIIPIATFIIKFVCKTSFDESKMSKPKTFFVIWIVLFAIFFLIFAVSSLFTKVVAMLHLGVAVAIVLILFALSYVIENYFTA